MAYGAENQRFARQIGVGSDVFSRPRVVLELPPGQEHRADAVSAFLFAANLLVRLFTNVHLVAPDAALGPNPWKLVRLRDAVDVLARISEGSVEWAPTASADIAIGVGAPPATRAHRSTFFSFSGWDAAIDMHLSSAEPGVFGPLIAACYGSAQAFLHAVQAAGGDKGPMRPFLFSLLEFSNTESSAAAPAHVDLKEVHLVGAGAVGSAAIYALACLPSLEGTLHAIDDDVVDDTNLNRYVLMRRPDVGRNKSDVVFDTLAGTGLLVKPYRGTFEAWLAGRARAIDLLLTPVDSEAGRRRLAMHLPREVLNAATGNSTVTLSRHGFADGRACLHCLYLPPLEEMTTEKRISVDTGLALHAVEALLAENASVTEAMARRIEQHRGVPVGTYLPWVGQRIQSFYQRAVCGSAPVVTASGTIVTPLSFISAAAGVMLAGEVVKRSVPSLQRFQLEDYFRLDTLFPPNPRFRQLRPQDPSGRCICHDPDFIETYRRRYLT